MKKKKPPNWNYRFTQLELELSVAQQKLQDQENLNKHLEAKHTDIVHRHQMEASIAKEVCMLMFKPTYLLNKFGWIVCLDWLIHFHLAKHIPCRSHLWIQN